MSVIHLPVMQQEELILNGLSGNNSCFLLFIEVIHLQLNPLFPSVRVVTSLPAQGALQQTQTHAVRITNSKRSPQCPAVVSAIAR